MVMETVEFVLVSQQVKLPCPSQLTFSCFDPLFNCLFQVVAPIRANPVRHTQDPVAQIAMLVRITSELGPVRTLNMLEFDIATVCRAAAL